MSNSNNQIQGKIFYTSDLHLFHNNVIKLNNRPFQDMDEMVKFIVNKWNAKVKNCDLVRIIGDVGYPKNKQDVENVIKILSILNGDKELVTGNHDTKFLKEKSFRKLFKKISLYDYAKDGKRKVVLFHYPIEEWNGYHNGSYHLFGHVHGNEDNLKQIDRRFNVGMDVNGFVPVTLDELITKAKI